MSSSFEYITKYFNTRFFGDGADGLSPRNGDRAPRFSLDGTERALTFPPFLGGLSLSSVIKDQPLELRMVPADEVVQNLLGEKEIPVLCERDAENPLRLVTVEENTVRIHFDLLGGAFYILTRMEEYLSPVRDEYDRFPAYASHALIHGYLHRPVVDEYVEILWHCIKRLWPGAKRRNESFRMMVTHDVDEPFRYALRPAWKVLRTFGGDLLRRHDVKSAFGNPARWFKGKYFRPWQSDPFYTFEKIMDMSEACGIRSAFYFLSGRSSPLLDGDYTLSHPYILNIMRRIHERNHEIGYHGSYNTYRDSEAACREVHTLRDVTSRLGVSQENWGGRQHILRWNAPITWQNYEKAGLNYDTTLSYADHAGFRCGTCHPFAVFDVEQDKALKLKEFALVVMECSVLDKRYMDLSPEKGLEHMMMLKNKCRKYHGVFCLLWHNSRFVSPVEREIYAQVLAE